MPLDGYSGQRAYIEVPTAGRSSYYPHDSAHYSTGSRGGGAGRSATYLDSLPTPTSGHRRFGRTTPLPSPLGYSSSSRRSSANIGLQNLVVPPRGSSRYESSPIIVSEFSHELPQRSPGIQAPPPCPDPPALVDRGHLTAHVPSAYVGRAPGARRSYYRLGQGKAVETERPSRLPIGMEASCHQYSASPILQRAKSYSDHPSVSVPEPSPRSFTFPSTGTSYSNPVVIEPYTVTAETYSPHYYPQATSSIANSYAPPPPPPTDIYTTTPSYTVESAYPLHSTDSFASQSPTYVDTDFCSPSADNFKTTAFDLPEAYEQEAYSVDYKSLDSSFGTPQDEFGTPISSTSSAEAQAYLQPLSSESVGSEKDYTKINTIPIAPVDIQPTSPPACVQTKTTNSVSSSGRYAKASKSKPTPISVKVGTEEALVPNPNRQEPSSSMAAPVVKPIHMDQNRLTPEEMGDECNGREDTKGNVSPVVSPEAILSYLPLSNLPTPPTESTNGPLDFQGGITEQQTIGGAQLLADKCPTSRLLKRGPTAKKIQYVMVPARPSLITLVMAAAILEKLESEVVQEIVDELDEIDENKSLVLDANIIVIVALGIAQKYQSDRGYTSAFWTTELNHCNEIYVPRNAKPAIITRQTISAYERVMLIHLQHRLFAIEKDLETMQRIRNELEEEAKKVDGLGFTNGIGMGRYTGNTQR